MKVTHYPAGSLSPRVWIPDPYEVAREMVEMEKGIRTDKSEQIRILNIMANKTFQIQAKFEVRAYVTIEAESEKAALDQVKKGGGWIDANAIDMDKRTLEFVELDTIEMTDDGGEDEPEDKD